MEEGKRLIEEELPIKDISNESGREKRQISSIHIWWARRPLQACRAAIYSALIQCPTDEKRREGYLKDLVELSGIERSNRRDIVEKAKKTILVANNGLAPKILDPFAGGGAIPLEAMRLGCEAYASDLNPIAYITELATLFYPQNAANRRGHREGVLNSSEGNSPFALVNDVNKWGHFVFEEARREIGDLYSSSAGSNPVGFIWARTVKCPNPNCGLEMPLIRQYWLARKSGKRVALKHCVDQEKRSVRFTIAQEAEIDFDPSEGTMKRGTVRCLFCGHTADPKYLRQEARAGNIGEKLLAVIADDPAAGKVYKEASKIDTVSFEKAKDKLPLLSARNLIPNELLPPIGTLGFRVNRYGVKVWRDLFNSRQLLANSTFALKISEVHKKLLAKYKDETYAKTVVTYLACVLDSMIEKNSKVCWWHNRNEQFAHTFRGKELPMTWDYAESNPFSGSSGSFESCLRSLLRSLIFCCEVESNPAQVKIGTATNLPYEDGYFDAVITDPPYYDQVPYADLSDFFYVWMKRVIGSMYPEAFSTPLAPKKPEIVQNPIRHGGMMPSKMFYEAEMTKAFREMRRVLKSNGICVIVFAHKGTAAWETLVSSLINSGLTVTASWPLHTEGKYRLRAQSSAALASSIFIICRKRLKEEDGYIDEVKYEVKRRVEKKLDEFWKEGIRGADFFISSIGPALEVFSKYKKVLRLSGEEVSVAEFLDEVREIVTDYSLKQILQRGQVGVIDEVTRFYVLYRWAYNNNEIHFDEARKMAQALGTESDQLINRVNLLQKKGEKVRLLDPKEREIKGLGQPKGGVLAPIVDVIHQACLLWEKGQKNVLQDFLSNSGYEDSEVIWNVAQTLSEILPEGNKEKQLIQGLLASKLSIIANPEIKGQTTLSSFKEES